MARVVRLVPDLSIARSMGALLTNTASPTVVRAGNKTNVIPGVAEVEIDGRLVPGQTADDFLRELRAVIGEDVELEVLKHAPATVTEPVESPLYDTIRRQIAAREPEAVVVPYMIPGFTDGKYFSQLGARWYGFTPLKIEKESGIRFADMFHGNDERIPVAGLHWGTEVLDAVVRDFCAEPAGCGTPPLAGGSTTPRRCRARAAIPSSSAQASPTVQPPSTSLG
jgi:acetylornithine deacetylase/succinyl-diaminopimelate desuccinylase-like protein